MASAPGEGPARAGRRGLPWGWTLALTGLLLAGGAAVALHSPWLKVHDIEIIGAERADVTGRLADAGIGPGAFMIWLRPGEIEEVVLADPWVREVRVERVFPSRLVVEVLEEVPALWAGRGTRWMLLSLTGRIVGEAEAPGEGMLQAQVPYAGAALGEAPEGSQWDELVALSQALSPELAAAARVTSEAGELWISALGWRARLGPAEDLAQKGRAFEALLTAGLPPGAAIDLLAPTRPAVSLPEGSATDQGEPVVEGEDDG